MISVKNLTSSLFLPSLPAGYEKQLIQNISITPKDGMGYNKVNTTVNVTIRYNCSVAFYKVIPFILSNDSWSSITTYTVKPKECSINFNVAADPIIAMAISSGSPQTTSTSSSTTVTPSSTTTMKYSGFPNGMLPYYVSGIAIVAIAAAALIAYYRRKKRREAQERKKEAAEGARHRSDLKEKHKGHEARKSWEEHRRSAESPRSRRSGNKAQPTSKKNR